MCDHTTAVTVAAFVAQRRHLGGCLLVAVAVAPLAAPWRLGKGKKPRLRSFSGLELAFQGTN
jgi:hypothetical protein